MKNLLLVILPILMVSCGDASQQSTDKTDETPEQESQGEQESPSELGSIFLSSKKDLPSCSEANETQLAYIKAKEVFYVCESGDWAEVEIKGKDGDDGVTTEVEATNKKNIWVDPVSSHTWLLGGPSNWSQASASCSGAGYRLPTYQEAEAAVNRGIRGIASSVPTGQDFWVSDLGYIASVYVGGALAGTPEKRGVSSLAAYSGFCVK